MNTPSVSPTVVQKPFQPVYPEEGLIVETNFGPAAYKNGVWFKWWKEMSSFGRTAMKSQVVWWKGEDGIEHRIVEPVYVNVKIGVRKFSPLGWTRKDTLYVGDTLIGVIKKSDQDITGRTICVTNSAEIPGWNPPWCLDQHLATVRSRAAVEDEVCMA